MGLPLTTFLGVEANLYYNSGNYNSPTWVRVSLIRNLTLMMSFKEWDSSSRIQGVATTEPTLIVLGVEGDMLYQPADTAWDSIQTDFFSRTCKDWAVMDGTIGSNTANGLRAGMKIFNFDQSEQLEEGLANKLTLKPSIEASADPLWINL